METLNKVPKKAKKKTQNRSSTAKLSKLEKQIGTIAGQLGAVLDQNAALAEENTRLKSAQGNAVNRPVSARQALEYDERAIYQGSPSTIPPTGDARIEYETDRVIPAEHLSTEKAVLIEMNETMVEVRVTQSNDPRDVPLPEVQIDGISQRFLRGHPQWVKLKYVLRLCELKRTTVTQEPYTDQNGDPGYRNVPHTALIYPFEVLQAPQHIREYIERTRNAS